MQDSELRGRVRDGDLLGAGRDYQHLPEHRQGWEIRRAGQWGSLREQCGSGGWLQDVRLQDPG